MRNHRTVQQIAWVLLPSFLFAAATDIVLFEIFDPVHPPFVRDALGMSRIVAFAEVLLSLWILAATGIVFTLVVRRVFEAPKEFLKGGERPHGNGTIASQDELPEID